MSLPSFFPRGPGPLVSVLLPSRGRSEHLREAVASLYQLASGRGDLEYLIKVDTDDVPSVVVSRGLAKEFPDVAFHIIASPRGRGYQDLHLWLNELAAKAVGDWLFVFTDDARMVTPGWDMVVSQTVIQRCHPGLEEVGMLLPGGDVGHFLVRRQVFTHLGHLSLHPCADLWLGLVMRSLRAAFPVPLEIRGVGTRAPERGWDDECVTSTATDYRSRMLEDAMLLSRHLDGLEARAIWGDCPKGPGWHVWKSAGGRRETVHVGESGVVSLCTNYNDDRYDISPERLLADDAKWHRLGEYA